MVQMPGSSVPPAIDTCVAIGDSFTEGLNDPAPGGGFRGWADLVASALRGIADEHDCDLVDLWSMRALKDARAWSPDRLHLTTEGHRQVARRACEVLGVPAGEDGRLPLPARPPAVMNGRSPWLAARRQDARWIREYAGPWLRRRVGGTSSGDGVLPKRPDLLPL
jgi:hypothetical protein